jgi:hypothetical protein
VLGSLAAGAAITLILLAPIHDVYTFHFWKKFASQGYVSWYLAIFLISFGVALMEIGRHSWRYANDAAHSQWLRRGLRLTAVGAYIALGYCLCRGIYLFALQSHVRMEFLVDMAIPFVCLGQTLIYVGLTMPSWGPHLTRYWTRRSQLRSCRSLYPLWSALYQAFPGVSLHSPSTERDSHHAMNDAGDLLYRRMIEIRDGLLVLRPYLGSQEAAVPDIAAEDSFHRRSVAEAQRIHRGLSARLRDERPEVSAGMVEISGADTAMDELAWLIALSGAFAQLLPLDQRLGGEPTSSSTSPRP